MMQALRHFLLAVQFFSRIPITGKLAAWVGWSPALQQASAAHLPGVGWLVGGCAAAVVCMVAAALPQHPYAPWLAALFSTAATLALTGGFHEDGLADVADGLGGHLPAARALEVMKDSRLGAYGAMALCMALLTKVALLAALIHTLPLPHAALLVCSVHVLSRGAPLALMRVLRHVSLPAQSKTIHIAGRPLGTAALGVACLWCAPAAGALACVMGMSVAGAILLAGALITIYMGWRFHRRLGGMTGDCLGATQQVGELAMYTAALCVGVPLHG